MLISSTSWPPASPSARLKLVRTVPPRPYACSSRIRTLGRAGGRARGAAARRPARARRGARRRRGRRAGAGGATRRPGPPASAAGSRARLGDADREVVLDRVVRPQLEPAGAVRREDDDVLLAGQPVEVGADAPVAEPQVPDAGARERRELEPRAEAPAVAARRARRPRRRRRDAARPGAPRRSPEQLALDHAARRPRRARAAPRRAAAAASTTTASRAACVACARTRSTPDGPATIADRRELNGAGPPLGSDAPGARAGGGEVGERDLALQLARVLGGARSGTRSGSAPSRLSTSSPPRPLPPIRSQRPSMISTRRATASAVPPAATRPG